MNSMSVGEGFKKGLKRTWDETPGPAIVLALGIKDIKKDKYSITNIYQSEAI